MRNILPLAAGLALFALPRAALAAPAVWAIDDGEKIGRDAIALPFAAGTDNPVWSPGQPVKLFALRGETVAFQIVVRADAAALAGVTVDLASLAGPGGATLANAPGANDPTSFVGRPIERFVEHYFDILRRSGPGSSSLGWSSGSAPSGTWTGYFPDALIPVEVAPTWSPYPLQIAPNQNGAVWIDVTVPETQAPGSYTGSVVVASQGGPLATLPLELLVYPVTLPDRPVQTMLYYDKDELNSRIGSAAAEEHLWKLYRRHHLTALHTVDSKADVDRQEAALDGSEFTAAHGYEGPGAGQPDGLVVLGTYGDLGAPTASVVSTVEGIADRLQQSSLFANSTVFLYAIDESCGSSLGKAWKNALAASSNANAQKVKVGWTCSQTPSTQPVDIPMVFASVYDPALAAAAKAAGKDVWIYNGSLPQTGTFFTDADAVELRANGWIAAMAGIPRWFYWETSFWYDGNQGGKGPYDPFATSETFHNSSGDECQGDGVLVYPGKQVDLFKNHSLGMDGVVASIRLKNFRRGVEDAGYYALAHAANPGAAEAIANGLLPKTLSAAHGGDAASWGQKGKPFFDARAALLALVPMPPPQSSSSSSSSSGGGSSPGAGGASASSGGASSSGATTGGASSGGATSGGASSSGAGGAPLGGSGGAGGAPSATSQSPGSAGNAGGCSAAGGRNGGTIAALGLALGLAFAARRRRRR